MLALYSDDPNSNPDEAYSFSVNLHLKRMKINKKRPRLAHFLNKVMKNRNEVQNGKLPCLLLDKNIGRSP